MLEKDYDKRKNSKEILTELIVRNILIFILWNEPYRTVRCRVATSQMMATIDWHSRQIVCVCVWPPLFLLRFYIL